MRVDGGIVTLGWCEKTVVRFATDDFVIDNASSYCTPLHLIGAVLWRKGVYFISILVVIIASNPATQFPAHPCWQFPLPF